jgi:hypothetical protein
VPYQTIFQFDRQNQAVGRTFDRSDNYLNLSFQKVPRRPGDVRFALAPVVKSQRKRIEYSVLNDEMEIDLKSAQALYTNLIVDVPAEHFVIVAPSAEASWPSSLGHAFLVSDNAAEQTEQVLILVAQPLIDDPSRR